MTLWINRARRLAETLLLAAVMAGCVGGLGERIIPAPATAIVALQSLPTSTILPAATGQAAPGGRLAKYAFPAAIDPERKYLFYLHGKILEDQGLPAVSPEFGEYQVEAILEKLSSYGFVVISEHRPKEADSLRYARRTAAQVQRLLKAGTPAKNITLVGASKGGYIAIQTSNMLKNEGINYVILAICNPQVIKELEHSQVFLYGNVLSIYDSVDEYGGSCQRLFSLSKDKGLKRHGEIVLEVGTGHGVLYRPLDEWIVPAVEWAR